MTGLHLLALCLLVGYALAALLCLVSALLVKTHAYPLVTKTALLITGFRGIYYFALMAATAHLTPAARQAEFTRPVHLIIQVTCIFLAASYCCLMIVRQNSVPAGYRLTWYGRAIAPTDTE